MREAQPDGVLTRQHVGREQHGPGRPLAGQARQPRRRPLVDHEAQLGRGDPERGVGCGNPEVAGDGELGAGTEGGALDRRDHRHRRVTDAEQQATQRRLERLVLDAGQIGAGTEVPAGASERSRELEGAMLISNDMNAAINQQIGREFCSSLQYVAVAAYFLARYPQARLIAVDQRIE